MNPSKLSLESDEDMLDMSKALSEGLRYRSLKSIVCKSGNCCFATKVKAGERLGVSLNHAEPINLVVNTTFQKVHGSLSDVLMLKILKHFNCIQSGCISINM